MKRPVFVVGCPRSGTTLVYSLLLAAGGFSVYRKETYFYDQLPRYPQLSTDRQRQRFLSEYLAGYLGRVPGLDVAPLVERALEQSRRAADFLPLLMDSITRAQGMIRWVEGTPAHVLHLDLITRVVPGALIVHVIRDGRDCALSNERQGWVPVLPWDRSRRVGVAALFWEWMVRAGTSFGRANPRDYVEVKFEDLVTNPRHTLRTLGSFLDHDLDYDRLRNRPIHSMHVPNTSFREERGSAEFNPVGRWQSMMSADDLDLCDVLIGHRLEELGYPRTSTRDARVGRWRARLMRTLYGTLFSSKHALKTRTPLGRVLTSPQVWHEQPRAGERLVIPARERTAEQVGIEA
jgi:Sulfotransferase family